MHSKITRVLLRTAVIAVLAVGGYFLLRGLDFVQLRASVLRASAWPLVVGAIINFGNLFCKSVAWHVLLAPAFNVRPLRLFRYAITTAAVSSLAPMRAGEVVRVWLLKSRDGVPVSQTMAVAIAEKIFDVVAMLMLVAPLPWLLESLPAQANYVIMALCGAVAIGAIAWPIAAHRLKGNIPAWFQGAVRVLRAPRPRLAAALGLLFVAWVVDLTVVLLVMKALGIGTAVARRHLRAVNAERRYRTPIHPRPGRGVRGGAITGLHFLGVPPEQSLAFAVLYHAIQIFPLLGVALADCRFVLKAKRQMSQSVAEI